MQVWNVIVVTIIGKHIRVSIELKESTCLIIILIEYYKEEGSEH